MCRDSNMLQNSQVTSLVSHSFSQYTISLVHVCLLSSHKTLFSIQKAFATPLHPSESHRGPAFPRSGYSCSFKLPSSTYCHHSLGKETFFELLLDSKHFFQNRVSKLQSTSHHWILQIEFCQNTATSTRCSGGVEQLGCRLYGQRSLKYLLFSPLQEVSRPLFQNIYIPVQRRDNTEFLSYQKVIHRAICNPKYLRAL